jgi:hypothetical protein
MRRLVLAAFVLTLLSAISACDSTSDPSDVPPLESLSGVDSLTVLIHFERSGVPISREKLENDVLEALEQAGVGLSRNGPPYLHVRVYCRCGEPAVSDRDTTWGGPATWHFGIWVDQSHGYRRVWGPLANICPSGPLAWSRAGAGPVAEGKLLESIQMWLYEFVVDYQAANPGR